MLGNSDAMATLAVKDIEVAKQFYEDKLGLTRAPSQESEVAVYKSGTSMILVYKSQYAGTNEATAATWAVADVEEVVQALKAKGVAFERYDFPGITLKGDVHVSGNRKMAWCKDPDGNILALVSQ
jgi:predicted enzyme related to lactoylglutathione lyase